jgi:hypothetical protein
MLILKIVRPELLDAVHSQLLAVLVLLDVHEDPSELARSEKPSKAVKNLF